MSSELILGFSLGAVAGSAALIWWVHFGEICFNPNCENDCCNRKECLLPDTDDVQAKLVDKVKDIKDDIVEKAEDVAEDMVKTAQKRKNKRRNRKPKREK